MIKLSNNCRMGDIFVTPKNWLTTKSEKAIQKKWCITYWFYDDNRKMRKQVRIRTMNTAKSLPERATVTKLLIERETKRLKKGYNPISNKIIDPDQSTQNGAIVGPQTRFSKAIKMAQGTLNLEGFTAEDMTTIVDNVIKTADKLFIDDDCIGELPIYEVKKRHIRAILNKLSITNNWSAHSWNKYRSYLMMLFKELGEYDAVESNIPREISKRKTVKRVRVLLSEDERKKVKEHLQAHSPRFLLFVNMFFHSGARISEFYRIKIGDVNLERQTIKVIIKKGREYIEVIKPIKNIALPYWKEYIHGYDDKNLFLMGEGLYPAAKTIRYDQINKRWIKIKNKLCINADFYALKHLNTDQVSEQIGIERAQKLNSHTSARTTKIYAINENAREMELIKKVANPF